MLDTKNYYLIPLISFILSISGQIILKTFFKKIKTKRENIKNDLDNFKENINLLFSYNNKILIINYIFINIFGILIESFKILYFPVEFKELIYKFISFFSIFLAVLFLIYYNIKLINDLCAFQYKKYLFRIDKKDFIFFSFSIILTILFVYIVKNLTPFTQIKAIPDISKEIKKANFSFYLPFPLILIIIISFYEELIIRFNFVYLDKLLINKNRFNNIFNPEKLDGILELSFLSFFWCFNKFLVKGNFFLYNIIFSFFLFYVRKYLKNFTYLGIIKGIYNILFFVF